MSAVAAALVLGSGLLFAPIASAQSNVAIDIMVGAQDEVDYQIWSNNEIYVTNDYGMVDLNARSWTFTGEVDGIRAFNAGGSSALSITSTGAVVGNTGSGIYVGGPGGTGIAVSAASVSGGTSGIFADNEGTGALSITSSRNVTGTNDRGISATNSSRGTDIDISTAAVSGGTNGIFANNLGGGAVTVISSGDVTGTNGRGINATNSSRGTDIDISTAAV